MYRVCSENVQSMFRLVVKIGCHDCSQSSSASSVSVFGIFSLSLDQLRHPLKANQMIIREYKEARTWMKIMQGRTRAGYCALTRSWQHLPPLDPGNLDTGANGSHQY